MMHLIERPQRDIGWLPEPFGAELQRAARDRKDVRDKLVRRADKCRRGGSWHGHQVGLVLCIQIQFAQPLRAQLAGQDQRAVQDRAQMLGARQRLNP